MSTTPDGYFRVSPHNPCRPPDWRWHRARGVVDATQPPASRSNDRPPGFVAIRRAADFYRSRRACRNNREIYALVMGDPELGWSFWIYASPSCARTKALLESYLLTGADDAEIAKRFGCDPAIIRLYHDIFFDVRTRLDNLQYIHQTVISAGPNRFFGPRESEKLWKSLGYYHGIKVLDIVTTGAARTASGTASPLDQVVREQVILSCKLQAVIASIAASENPEAQVAMLRIYPEMLEIEQYERSAKDTNTAVHRHVAAMIEAISPKVVSRFDPVDPNSPTAAYDLGPCELSPEEMIRAANGETFDLSEWNHVFDQPAAPEEPPPAPR